MNLGSKTLNKTTQAFTLIDVMVGMGVLGVVLLSLFAAFSFGFSVVKISREDLQATQILQEKMEVIRLYEWTQFTTAGYVPKTFVFPTNGTPIFSGQVDIGSAATDATYSNDLRQVTITLSWTNNNIPRTRSTRTFVSRYGLQIYELK